MGGQIQWTVSLVMIGLFTIAILGFAVHFAEDNDAKIDIADDPELAGLYTNTSGDISWFNTDANSTYNSIISTSISPTAASGTTTTSGSFSITPRNVISITSNIMRVGYQKIFGSGSEFQVFIMTLIGLLVFITGLYIWKTWAGRSPD
jgi:hypothetical protein